MLPALDRTGLQVSLRVHTPRSSDFQYGRRYSHTVYLSLATGLGLLNLSTSILSTRETFNGKHMG